MVMRLGQPGPFGDLWQTDRLRLQAQARWRPDADTYETATTIEIVVDLAGVDEDDFELQLFEDALVVEGRRQLLRVRRGPCTTRPDSPGAVSARAAAVGARRSPSASRRATIMACCASRCPSARRPADGSGGRRRSQDFVIPDALPVLPLRDAVVLPLTAVPLAVGRAALRPARRRRHARQPAAGAGGAARRRGGAAGPDDLHRSARWE